MRTTPITEAQRPRPAGKREQNKLDKRDRIREAAERLFTERGFESTTTAAVAAEAGVATGTLFLYADDKVDLLFLVFNHRMEAAFSSAILGLRRSTPLLDQLAHLHEGYFEVYGDQSELGRHLVANLCTSQGRGAKAMAALSFATIGQIVAILREGVARGDVDPAIDPYVAARNVYYLYYGALVAWISGAIATIDDASALFRRALDLQLRGFAPPTSARHAPRPLATRKRA